ncbi:MAB_1171c family putative transporter [Kitasatospora sp. HPMI-4]|uniref:MAB_1171c family putative transporter n=1 Tax=Kitasatospora sp. HPMI-4 TaxID=3448443 RepID=UPI003F1C32B8
MVNAFNLAATALLWLVSAWRAPAALRTPGKRPLWAAFTILAAEMILSHDAVARRFDLAVGINSLSALLKHLAAVTAAACVVAFLADASAADGTKIPHWDRLRLAIPGATVAAMVACFALANRPSEALDIFTADPHDPWVVLYGITWLSYFGWAIYATTRLSWQWSKHPGPRPLRMGLTIISAGAGIGILYTLHKAAMLALSFFKIEIVSPSTDETLNVLLAIIPLIMVTIGSTLPAYDKAHRNLRDQRDLVVLYRLWRELTDAVPSVRLGSVRGLASEAFDFRNSRNRLYRRTIEIRDAILTLSDHAPLHLREQAVFHASSAGLLGDDLDQAAEACWIRAALQARLEDRAPTGSSAPPAAGGADLRTEISALRGIARFYFSSLASTFSTSPSKISAQEYAE